MTGSFGDDIPERDGVARLPLGPDVERSENVRPRGGAPFAGPRRTRWPRISGGTVVAVAAGGSVGGVARYAVGLAWPSAPGTFPWATFAVNTGGAFLLALLLVLIMDVLPPTTYLRPALGTGFCGALTTFSSVATGVDQLIRDGRSLLAAGYVAASIAAGLAAAALGLIVGRSVAAYQERERI